MSAFICFQHLKPHQMGRMKKEDVKGKREEIQRDPL